MTAPLGGPIICDACLDTLPIELLQALRSATTAETSQPDIPAATIAAPLLDICRRCGSPSAVWVCGACEVPPDPSATRRTLDSLLRATLEMRAFLAEPTPYDMALLALARAVRRERLDNLSSDLAVANSYTDDPDTFLADFDGMTPAQQARTSLRVARAWGLDVSQVDQLWLESRRLVAA